VGPALSGLIERLEAVKQRRPELAAALESALASLRKLRSSSGEPERIEASLARLDRRLARSLHEALPDAERRALDAEVEAQLGGAAERMDAATLEKTTRVLTRRAIRERTALPRLTLL
jgi:hypothetical protein